MMTRVVLVVLVVAILGGAAIMSMNGIWGESNSVKSTRNGSLGGGYGIGGRVK